MTYPIQPIWVVAKRFEDPYQDHEDVLDRMRMESDRREEENDNKFNDEDEE